MDLAPLYPGAEREREAGGKEGGGEIERERAEDLDLVKVGERFKFW